MLKHAKDIFSVSIGLAGLALLSYGAYLYKPAAGFCVLGAALVVWSYLIASSKG
jgi:hypothetical protein